MRATASARTVPRYTETGQQRVGGGDVFDPIAAAAERGGPPITSSGGRPPSINRLLRRHRQLQEQTDAWLRCGCSHL